MNSVQDPLESTKTFFSIKIKIKILKIINYKKKNDET